MYISKKEFKRQINKKMIKTLIQKFVNSPSYNSPATYYQCNKGKKHRKYNNGGQRIIFDDSHIKVIWNTFHTGETVFRIGYPEKNLKYDKNVVFKKHYTYKQEQYDENIIDEIISEINDVIDAFYSQLRFKRLFCSYTNPKTKKQASVNQNAAYSKKYDMTGVDILPSSPYNSSNIFY